MTEPRDLEMGVQGAQEVEDLVARAHRLWREFEKSREGWPGVAIALATDRTLDFHCVRSDLFYLLERYQEDMIDAITGKVLQREKDGVGPARGERDELYEELCIRTRNRNQDLVLHRTIETMSVPDVKSLRRMENIIKRHVRDYNLPPGGEKGMFRVATDKDPVYRLLEYILSRKLRWLLFWMPAEEFTKDGFQITSIGMDRIDVTAKTTSVVGVLLTIILPVSLLIFGSGSSDIFSGLALGICVLAVVTMLYTGSMGALRLALAYLTVILTAVLARQFAST
ncbi:uncharacterized protein DNG_08572 [Cephalotrichum gorgonifer]|uniref:Uncharacterized protein n=1 Tax=Cephalotrichum gorgonifer TaxID=2041049 RepID=A0AAE8N5T9_9PEZI|nr:uncharacterized protein DNG_08572 [Cephalotrichum gorgonifer]